MKKLILALIVIVLVSCASSQEKQTSENLEILFPLQVGNTWNFIGDDGNHYFAEILDKVIIDGRVWYKYRELGDEDTFYVNNSSEGQIEIDIDTKEQMLVLPYPVKKEKTYFQYGVKSRVTPDVKISVKAGVFNAYKYDFSVDDPESPIILWVAPGLGPVKIMHQDETYELVEYNL